MRSCRILVLCFFLLLSAGCANGHLANTDKQPKDPALRYFELGASADWYDNEKLGYRLKLPAGSRVLLENTGMRNHIILADGRTVDVYLSNDRKGSSLYYLRLNAGFEQTAPNCFINRIDHQITRQTHSMLHGFSINKTMWTRVPLAKISDDRRFYYAIDMALDEHRAVSFVMKSATPIAENDVAVLDDIAAHFKPDSFLKDLSVQKDYSPMRDHRYLNRATKAFYDEMFAEKAPLRWGIFEPKYAAHDYKALDALEKDLGTRFHVLVHYLDFRRSDIAKDVAPVLRQAAKEGRAVELTIQTFDDPSAANSTYAVLNGDYDGYLTALAKAIQNSGAVVLLRVGNEMNGCWCTYSPVNLSRDPDLYVAFYRYVIDRLEENGAGPQMLYVWNPNAESFPDYAWNHPYLAWPGNRYVDVVGLTAYNTGTYFPGEKWRTFDDMYRLPYREMSQFAAQPMMITEFACSSIGGDKVAWLKDALPKISREYPLIKVAIWWNSADRDPKDGKTISRPYYLNETPETTAVFRNYFTQNNPPGGYHGS